MSVDILEATEFPSQPMAQVDQREIRKQQINDTCLGFWIRLLLDRKVPNKSDTHTRADLTMFKQCKNLKLIREMLYREVVVDSQKKTQIVLPSSFIESVLTRLHNDMGHPSKDGTMALLHERFFWPGLFSTTESWIANCKRCIRRKSKTNIRAPLFNISTTYPLELVCLDYLI